MRLAIRTILESMKDTTNALDRQITFTGFYHIIPYCIAYILYKEYSEFASSACGHCHVAKEILKEKSVSYLDEKVIIGIK